MKTVVLDFDGVIHSYKSGWKGLTVIPDDPVPGIRQAISDIREAGYEVIVVSSRCSSPEGVLAIAKYLEAHEIYVDGIREKKPPAIVYIDDRAICFNGNANELLEKIQQFKPWHKKDQSQPENAAMCSGNPAAMQMAIDVGIAAPTANFAAPTAPTAHPADLIKQALEKDIYKGSGLMMRRRGI